MLRFLKWTVVVLVIVLSASAAYVFVQLRSLEWNASPTICTIKGLGGNVAVLKTGAGTVIVDTMTFTMQGVRIRHLAESLTANRSSW
jgi:hypothetical protein